MSKFKFIRSGIEWGLFYGILTWISFTVITSKTPNAGVWGMIISRVIQGGLSAFFPYQLKWWMRGLIWGAAIQLVFSLGLVLPESGAGLFFYAWKHGYFLMLLSSLVFGVLIEFHLERRKLFLEEEGRDAKK